MKTVNITAARKDLFNLVNLTAENNEPILITGKHNNAVIVSETDWNSIEETLYILSIPGMKEKIIRGMKTPLEECVEVEL
ncbi:MAG: type II toxin-antitoxin system Phd/YefM family antitoxin [Ignavibacteriaceae bacterium]|nr:type II toxin-antitoxin system Phd/YefM family antitoxin [Ignavibacteriaceae bacterium]